MENNAITLYIGEKYKYSVLIDITTFCYYGHVENGKQEDCEISFRQPDLPHVNPTLTVSEMRQSLAKNLNVKPEEYVRLRNPENHDEDHRPIISVRLPSGIAGIRNPAQFEFRK